MHTFHARLYDNNSGKDRAVQMHVQTSNIIIEDMSEALPFSEVTFEITGQDEDRIKISCPSRGLTLISKEKELLDALIRADKSGVRSGDLRKVTAKTKALPVIKGTYWLRVGAVLAAHGVGTWLSLNELVDVAADKISPEMEISLGRSSLSKRYESHSKAAQRVQRVGEKLIEHLKDTPYKFEFFASRDKTINAFALPGGFLVVNTGLLDKIDSDDELAGVLGHEIGHVIHRDSLHKLLHSGGVLCCIGVIAGTFGENGEKLAETLLVAQTIERQSFGRAQEARADITGCDLAVDAGYDGEGIIKFFKKIEKETDMGDNKMLALLSDHPMTADRITAIRAELDRLKKIHATKSSDVDAAVGKDEPSEKTTSTNTSANSKQQKKRKS